MTRGQVQQLCELLLAKLDLEPDQFRAVFAECVAKVLG